ncbi:MAG: DUF3365 domain-containing protein [Paraglaciecola sp.]|uniref:Tll0287-like domain-containing protein n=1 Tax=Paraglaciecola sp. TaxID=1920173 RepID=UPI0032973E5A
MRKLLLITLTFTSINLAYAQQTLEKAALIKVKQYSTELKAALLGAIQQGGLENAVEVCQSQAPQIAKNLSSDGWQINRTSLKARNENNQPDAWETQMLMQLDKTYKEIGKSKPVIVSKIEENTFRYMQAIPTGPLCLSCHGQSVAPELLEKIQQHYPTDLAVGFTLEDIRGAFTLSKNMQ